MFTAESKPNVRSVPRHRVDCFRNTDYVDALLLQFEGRLHSSVSPDADHAVETELLYILFNLLGFAPDVPVVFLVLEGLLP